MINSSTSSRGVFKFTASAMAVGLVVLAGCSMESSEEDAEDAEGVSVVESTSSALSAGCGIAMFVGGQCPTPANGQKSHAEATRIMRYVFGDDSAAPAPGPWGVPGLCPHATVLPALVRARIAAGTVSLQRASGTVCGRPSVIYTLRPTNGVPIAPAVELSAYSSHLTTCNGWSGTAAFSLVDSITSSGSCTAAEVNQNTYVRLDPEAVTLTANLTSSTSGATAAAVGVDTGDSTTAIRWGSSYTSCGSYGAYAGSPCTTTAAYSGNTLDRRLVKKGTLCACL